MDEIDKLNGDNTKPRRQYQSFNKVQGYTDAEERQQKPGEDIANNVTMTPISKAQSFINVTAIQNQPRCYQYSDIPNWATIIKKQGRWYDGSCTKLYRNRKSTLAIPTWQLTTVHLMH
jgi:hypothetical protein